MENANEALLAVYVEQDQAADRVLVVNSRPVSILAGAVIELQNHLRGIIELDCLKTKIYADRRLVGVNELVVHESFDERGFAGETRSNHQYLEA